MSDSDTLRLVMIVGAALLLGYGLWLVIRRRLRPQAAEMAGQLVPVVALVVVFVTVLVIIDPDQGDLLVESTLRYLPRAFAAVIVVILARAIGRVLGVLAESALRRISTPVAVRGRVVVTWVVTVIGGIVALQQLGVSTDVLLLMVGGLVGALSLAIALLVGFGALPLARQVAAGRHVLDRYAPGDVVTIGDTSGEIVEIGLATTRLATDDDTIDVPHLRFLDTPVVKTRRDS